AGLRLISAREISDVVRLATASGALVLEADHALLRLEDPETKRYVIRSYYGGADRSQREQLFALDKDVSVEVIRRREPLLVHRVDEDDRFDGANASVRSILGAPLLRDGRVVGALTFYDKMAGDEFFPGYFSRDDVDVLSRYARYVERAVTNALFYRQAQAQTNFDESTGLPNAEYLARRVDQEMARGAGRTNAFALATCRIENLPEVRNAADPAHADRVVQRTAEAMRQKLRDFDVLARTADDEFAALIPEPGEHPGDRVADLARQVAETIVRDEALNEPLRIGLVFGYSLPEGSDEPRESLLARAREPRIRML
ncbi:MAG: diguanylate cyclase, partial [Myxococcales bacterium]|nr:diguanylate cyclase [Myxococcales bacterium]